MERQRIFYLDLIRVFAILGIIYSHVAGQMLDAHTVALQNMFVGSAALFFMTSGALIFPITAPGAFVRRRLRSYVPEFVLWSVAYALLGHWTVEGYPSLGRALGWMLFTPTFDEAWFLYALTGAYLFAPFLSPWIASASRRQVEWFLAAWLCAGLTPLALEHTFFHVEMSILAPFFGYMGFMVAGYYLNKWPVSARSWRGQALFYVITAGVGIVGALRVFVTAWRWNFADLLASDLSINVMCMCMLWFALLQNVRKAPRWIAATVSAISVCTLGIYLSQPAALTYLVLPRGWDFWPTLLATLVLAIAVGAVMHGLRKGVQSLLRR